MKKYIKLIIIVFLISLGLFTLKDIKAEDNDGTYQNGDLKCPSYIYGAKVKCNEILDKNGRVTEVDITYGSLVNNGDIQIKKIVTKTGKVGHYNVKFEISGKNVNQQATVGPTYIVFILDASNSLYNDYNKAKDAIRKFANTLIPDSDNGNSSYHIKLYAFGNSTTTLRGMSNSNLNSLGNGSNKWPKFYQLDSNSSYQTDLGVMSYVGTAFQYAYNDLSKLPADANKYVILFGDGDYFAKSQISSSSVLTAFNTKKNLERIDATILGIRYNNMYNDKVGCGDPNTWLDMCTVCKNVTGTKTQTQCSEASMKALTNTYKNATNANTWATDMITLANDIKDETKRGGVTSELQDQSGYEFFLDSGRYKNFKIKNFSNTTYTTEPFEIEIDPFADPDAGPEKYWHKTNENFKFSYTDENGVLKEITVVDSPLAYWIPDKTELNSCYDTVQTSNVRSGVIGDQYGIYSKECVENGYKVVANVSNFDVNTYKAYMGQKQTQKFNLNSKNGYKFPITLDLSSNVVCTYTFNVTKYNQEINDIDWNVSYLQDAIVEENKKCSSPSPKPNPNTNEDNPSGDNPNDDNTTGDNQTEEEEDVCDPNLIEIYNKEIASLAVRKDSLKQAVPAYLNIISTSSSELDIYKDNFLKQEATLWVKYPDLNKMDELSLTNEEGTTVKDPWCDDGNYVSINGYSVPTSKVCHAEFKKTMIFGESCLSMQNGDQEECSAIKAQIDGGENYYIKRGAERGVVNLSVPNAGFEQKLNFNLARDKNNNDACTFTVDGNDKGDIIFRQIDVNDPFLKEYPDREVGLNYQNSKFDFEKIIHSDTWSSSNEPEYTYNLSKTNIVNINKDTSEDPVNSYLGRNCYFTIDNKYRCRFTRNETDSGFSNSDYWFTTS